MTYVKYNSDGSITMSADWPFPDSEKVDFNVIRGYDGKFYREGEEPVKSDEQIKEELFASLKAEQEKRLSKYDYMFNSDYPDSEFKELIKAYRQAVREINNLEGAPFDGGGENTPWPVEPEKN